jgi:hypothetical protein
VAQDGRDLDMRHEAGEMYPAAERLRATLQRRAVRPVADHHQLRARGDPPECLQQRADVFLRGQAPHVGDPRPGQAGKRIRRRLGEQCRVVAGRDHVHAVGWYPVVAQQPGGRRGQRDHRLHAGQQPPLRHAADCPQHMAARCRRAERMPHAEMKCDDDRAAMAAGRDPGQRQGGQVLAAVHVDQVHPPAAQRMRRGQRRPGLPQHRDRQAGPDHLAVRAELDPVGRTGQPRRHHELADAQAVQAPGQLGDMVLHPADGVVADRARRQLARLEDRTQAQYPQHSFMLADGMPPCAASGQPTGIPAQAGTALRSQAGVASACRRYFADLTRAGSTVRG